ncbi:hypothetical protein BDD12DRAFT_19648 [Trichophaea hybrida]|nr:hypothetical protein BDD12DRAFT_19648 [Trichophaea hybrida]
MPMSMSILALLFGLDTCISLIDQPRRRRRRQQEPCEDGSLLLSIPPAPYYRNCETRKLMIITLLLCTTKGAGMITSARICMYLCSRYMTTMAIAEAAICIRTLVPPAPQIFSGDFALLAFSHPHPFPSLPLPFLFPSPSLGPCGATMTVKLSRSRLLSNGQSSSLRPSRTRNTHHRSPTLFVTVTRWKFLSKLYSLTSLSTDQAECLVMTERKRKEQPYCDLS